MCSYSVVFLSLTIILLDIDPMKLPQVGGGNGSCVEKGSIIESKKERGRQIRAAGKKP